MSTDSGCSLEKDKPVYDITKFTHLDYPDHLACIVWFAGCNMRCLYCYNEDIVLAKSGRYTIDEVMAFLRTRRALLDGVVLSGGEASRYDLVPFCQGIKELGFDIKLDTNGTNPKLVGQLLEERLVDYVALDYKAPREKFSAVTQNRHYDEFLKTLGLLLDRGVDFEVRTTLHADLLSSEDINLMIKELQSMRYKGVYYIQEFVDTGQNIANLQKPKKSFDRSSLLEDIQIVWR